MRMIKEGLGLAPSNITPEYLLKMYYKGYNAALDDVKDIIDKVQTTYVTIIQETVPHSNIIYRGDLADSCNTLIKEICSNITDSLIYKELPKK